MSITALSDRNLPLLHEIVDRRQAIRGGVMNVADGYRSRSVIGVGAGLAVLWLCFGRLLGPLDLLTFLHAGRQVLNGKTPYAPVTSSTFISGHAFVYPAFVAWLFAPLALIPGHLAVLLYTLLSAAAVIIAARWFDRGDLHAPMLVLVSSTTVVALQMGTVNPFLLLGLAAAWRWRGSHPLGTGFLLGAVAGVKLFLAPVLLWPLMRRRYSSALAAFATFGAILAAQTALGRIGVSQYVAMLSKLQNAEGAHSWSILSMLHDIGLAGPVLAPVVVGLGAASMSGLLLARNRLTDPQMLGLIVLVCLLVSPIIWSSYLLLTAAPLLLLSDDNRALAVATLVSWVIVTPDQASEVRVAMGVGLAVVASYLSVRPRVQMPSPRTAGLLGLAAGVGVVLLLLPDSVRSPIPALAAVAALAAWTWRAPARGLPTPAAAVEACSAETDDLSPPPRAVY